MNNKEILQVITAKPITEKLLSALKPAVKTIPLNLFSAIADLPWSTWLDSCKSTHVDSCYDILVFQPTVTLCTVGDNTSVNWIKNKQKNTISQEDPLLILKKIQQQVFTNTQLPQLELPFKGGAVGYFAYDLGRRFEKLPELAEQDLKLPEMAVGIYTKALVFNHKTNQHWLVCPENERENICQWLLAKLLAGQTAHKQQHKFTLTSKWRSNISKQQYIEKFNQVQDYLLSGDCYQINLAQRFSANYQGDEFEAYKVLREKNKAPFSAFMRLDNISVLSISPERFLQLKQNKVQSKPIKGTIARSLDKTIDQQNAITLQNSTKDRAENVMIVDLLRHDISKVCQAGSVKVPQLFAVESFPAVHHLVSTVEGILLDKFDGGDLLRAAFPGGSITGAPKIRAMEIIDSLEPHRRSIYCGSIGYLSACGNMDTSITIRTLIAQKDKVSKNTLYCWAGGGLVADSSVESEYQETFDKVDKILPVLSSLT